MPRFLYWTILIGDEPTAFRAREAADLRPTLVQLQRTHPDAKMKWFERGRLWSSPAEARATRETERAEARRRPSTWRPGGVHKDPRQKYIDAKKAKWTRFKDRIRERHETRRAGPPPAAPPGEREGAPPSARPKAPDPRAPKADKPDAATPRPPLRARPQTGDGKRPDRRTPFGDKPSGGRSSGGRRPSSARPPRNPRKG